MCLAFFLHGVGRADGVVISLVLTLVLTHLQGSLLHEQTFTFTLFTLIFFSFFSALNFFLGKLTCREEAHSASQPAELCSKAVRTVFINASSGFSLRGAQNTPESSLSVHATLEYSLSIIN